MKKIILLTTALISFTFAQTGMLTPAGDSGMGVWLNHGLLALDDDNYEGTSIVGFDYMTSIGVEVGLNIGDGWKGIELGYHHSIDTWGVNVEWSRQMMDDFDIDADNLWFRVYCDSNLYGGIGGSSWNGGDWEFETITFGKIWTMDMGMSVGVSYTAMFEYMDEGEVKINLGYTF